MLGELKGVGRLLPQALAQMARGLQKSLELYQVYDARDPVDSVLETTLLLNQATRKAAQPHRHQIPRVHFLMRMAEARAAACPSISG